MEFTGERYVPGVHGQIEIEHIHRYLQAARVATGKVVLDIASGEGYGAGMLAVHATSVIGVDISPEAVEHGRSTYRRNNLEFLVGTCSDIPVADGSVDLVVSFETLEHHDQHDRMMQEIKRVLRPDGLLLMSTPDKLHYTVEPSRLNPFHVKELYREEFEQLLSKHFAHTAYFAQRVLYGSGIFATHPAPPLDSYLLGKDVVKQFSGLSAPTYWIALASDGPLAEMASSVLEQPLDELELTSELKRSLAEYERHTANLTEGVVNRDGQIAQLTHTLSERDATISRLEHATHTRDDQIADLSLAVAEGRELIDLRDRAAASTEQREWHESLLDAARFTPLSLSFPNAWVGHLPFAAWLIRGTMPQIFVELGTHSGNSFFTFCQAVAESRVPTRCYAVDTWHGEEHAGRYDESVFTKVNAHYLQHYASFARLLRMTFDQALGNFSEQSVNLIHIDGLHTYEAVRHDFETWLPKLAPGAVVLFHDTNVRERNFGVWKFWEELQAVYPRNLEFTHSHGLGVLQLNDAPDHARLPWLEPGSRARQLVLDFFASLGICHLDRQEVADLRAHTAHISSKWAEHDGHIIYRDGQIAYRDAQIAALTHQLAERDGHIARMTSSRSWRSMWPLRTAGRVARRLAAKWGAGSAKRVMPVFDAAWYLDRNPDVKAGGLDPLRHFMENGGFEGRDPHPLFDVGFYLRTNPDVRSAGVNPLVHFMRDGWKEGRQPHPLFDTHWYLDAYPDVRAAGVNPLIHFLQTGWTEGRSPSPAFNLPWYLEANPDLRASGMNPLRHYVEVGAAEGRPVQPPSPERAASVSADAPVVSAAHDAPAVSQTAEAQAVTPAHDVVQPPAPGSSDRFDVSRFLPCEETAPVAPPDVTVDIVIPVYRGLVETRRCLASVLADPDRPRGVVRVIDDCSPDAELSRWLLSLAETGAIALTRHANNRGFVRSVMRGMVDAGRGDVLLLNSDTEVPAGFLSRLAGHAYSGPKIASVTPFSNTGGEMCGFPSKVCGPLPPGYSVTALDQACARGNGARAVEIPTGVGFCLYIRRDCLDDVGGFDAETFGRGYGEETDFCQRALARGWRHLLACNTFVYHIGEVSFGGEAPERATSWNTLVGRHPDLPARLMAHLAARPNEAPVFAATISLFNASPLPTVLMITHNFPDSELGHVDAAVRQTLGTANVLVLRTVGSALELSVPSIPGHPSLTFPDEPVGDLSALLTACSISRVHLQHWVGIGPVLHDLIDRLGAPLDLAVHDYFSV